VSHVQLTGIDMLIFLWQNDLCKIFL